MLQLFADVAAVGIAQTERQLARHFAADFDVVQVAIAVQDDLVGTGQTLVAQNLLFNLRREYVDAANDQHVVRAAGDLVHAAERARGRCQQARQIAGAVANHREGFLGQRGEHQFAFGAVGQHFAGIGVDDFWVEMVFPNHRAVFGLNAFACHAGAHDFGQAVDVDSVQTQIALNFSAHALAPRLGTKNADLERNFFWRNAPALEFFSNHQRVRRRDHDDFGLEINDLLHLLFRLATRHRHHDATRALSAVMRAQAASKHAVAISVVQHVAGATTGRANRTRHQVGPVVDVVGGVADDDGFASGARRSVQARQLLAWHGKQAKRIVIAQIRFSHERKLGQVGQRFQIVRMHTFVVKGFFVVWHVVVSVLERPLQALQLQRGDFVAAGLFNRF